MILELHIWGPAFGLPSIDAECIAAVAFLNSTLSKDEWVVIPGHDPKISPHESFPALKDDTTWIGGYQAILRYIKQSRSSSRLDDRQEADIAAFSSFINLHGLPLIDIYLYVSYANYSNTVRKAYTHILPGYGNYIHPDVRRDTARRRADHLHIRALDIDTTHSSLGMTPHDQYNAEVRAIEQHRDYSGKEQAQRRKDHIDPQSQRSGPLGNTWQLNFAKWGDHVLKTPEAREGFKLAALSAKFFEPLNTLLADKPYLLSGSTPSSLDCLALGYLSLLLLAPVPRPFFAEDIKTRYPKLRAYILRQRDGLLGGTVSPDAIRKLNSLPRPHTVPDIQRVHDSEKLQLPWHPAPPAETLLKGAWSVVRESGSGVPELDAMIHPPVIRHVDEQPPVTWLERLTSVNTLMVGVGSVVVGVIAWHARRKRHDDLYFERPGRVPFYGQAGTFFAALGQESSLLDL